MRPTWVVLGVVVGLGAVAYVKLRSKAEDTAPLARAAGTDAPAGGQVGKPAQPAPGSPGPVSPAPSPSPAPASGPAPAAGSASEARAASLRAEIAAKLAAHDAAGAATLEKTLDTELAETDEARRHAFARGWRAWGAIEGRDVTDVAVLDRPRRDLSRGLFLPEMFEPSTGKPSEVRARAIAAIQQMNTRVMTWRAGVVGVTTPYKVARGDRPVQIVTQKKLPFGHNAILFWNHGGNLDPSRLRADETLLLPLEPVTLQVDRARHRMAVLLGGVFVKEFLVGVGKPSSPTYPGAYEVGAKHQNPDWWSPSGKIPYGDPRNELGEAWIPIANAEHPTGYGIHGTNKPDTVGTDCSEGCVRLRNEDVKEVFWWVRTGSAGGVPTKVLIR